MLPIWLFWSWSTRNKQEPPLDSEQAAENSTKRYVAALIEYDGTSYAGFQYQPHALSIQEALETALATFCQVDGRVVGSGRTDSGVHARGQVIAVRVVWKHSLMALLRAWNTHLPASILVRSVCAVPEGFHPRFRAVRRTYRYFVQNATVAQQVRRSPLTDRFALYEDQPLDVAAMQAASGYLIGEHDFATFGWPTQGDKTVRRIDEATWLDCESNLPMLNDTSTRQLVFTITANAFLRHMVRNIVGTLLEVGRGRWSPGEVQNALLACDRSRCAPPASATGLFLERVVYPAEMGLNFELADVSSLE